MDINPVHTSMRSVHLRGKSSSATRETDSATCARIALSTGLDKASIAGTSSDRRAALSCSASGWTSWPIVKLLKIYKVIELTSSQRSFVIFFKYTLPDNRTARSWLGSRTSRKRWDKKPCWRLRILRLCSACFRELGSRDARRRDGRSAMVILSENRELYVVFSKSFKSKDACSLFGLACTRRFDVEKWQGLSISIRR